MQQQQRHVFAACTAMLAAALIVAEAKTQQNAPESDSGALVCLPGVYLSPNDACLPSGPSVRLTELARIGLTVPTSPLPAFKPNSALQSMPFRYFHVISDTPVEVGSAPGAAGAEVLLPGFVYIGYADRVDTGSGIYYLTQSGGWIPGKGERVGEIPAFQGLEFRSTPHVSFGWTFEELPVRSGPGLGFAGTGTWLPPFSVVQIYSSQGTGIDEWVMVGSDEWIEGRKAAQVVVSSASPDGTNGTSRWIDVNLAEQTPGRIRESPPGVRDHDRIRSHAVLDPAGHIPDSAQGRIRDDAKQRPFGLLLS